MASVYWFVNIMLFLHLATTIHTQDFRLPQSVIPTNYNLRLQPILDQASEYTRFTAPGSVQIRVNCMEDTSSIKLHALDLTILENLTRVTDVSTGELLGISSLNIEPEYQFLVVNLESQLNNGSQYDLYIEFVTPVSQSRLDGMYLDSYVDPATNETRYVATTLFAAISARRCFPSFDEPQMKAIFSIELVRKDGYHSLSNRHIIATEPLEGKAGWYVDKFAPSLPMSTYLVAMIVSDMTYEEAIFPGVTENDDTRIRVYAPYYLINRGGGVYAANQTKTVLSSFENYFNNTFLMDKLDSVSLPRFFFSAMENWALITYNDRVLLYFPGETTESERYRITSIIAHEVVHNYFGNLVTCEWWTWIWLNEGGATYFSHLGVEMTYPEFNPWDRFVSDVLQVAMDFDSSPATHPVANEPTSLADIGAIYDDIAYEKGASLLRMLQSFVTEPVMQTAIRKYLKEKQFANARQDDLFLILQETAEDLGQVQPASIKEIMDTWTLLTGYPLLRVSRINSTHISISQEKFELDPDPSNPSKDMWWIPISIAVLSPVPKEYFLWMSNKENETVFSIPDTEVFIVNPKSEGYYRTLYSVELLQNLLSYSKNECYMNHNSKLSSAGKAKLIDDYLAFKKAGYTNVQIEILAMQYFCLEHESLVVWNTLMKHYQRELLEVYQNGKVNTAASKVKSSLAELLPSINGALSKKESSFQWKGEKAILQEELTFWTCFIDVSQFHCRSHVENKMNEWINNTKKGDFYNISPFPVDLEETFFCIASSLNTAYWEQIYQYMESRHLSAAKARIANALMCTKNIKLIERILPHLNELKSFMEADNIKLPIKSEMMPYLRTTLRLLFNEPVRKLLVNS